MFLRIVALLALAAVFLSWKGRTKRAHRHAIARVMGGRSMSYAQIARALHHPSWLARELASLRQDGLLELYMPEEFDGSRPREQQVIYGPRARSSKG